ncbi:MAG: pirin family protein [Candidatus Sumerlaeia bacterium]|nr:pirin family protein [Candidatus Sumerlaeia bacterium]
MLTVRRAEERGAGDHGWLESRHTFSFADYVDRRHMGFRNLRVINEDHVAGGRGFGAHPHANMEIFSWIVAGGLTHGDSMGHRRTVRPGDVQYMSAGSGVHHSEMNASATEPVHLLQVWILPNERDAEPRYEDRNFGEALAGGGLVAIVSGSGREGAIAMRADAEVFAARPRAGAELRHRLTAGRGGWVQVVRGTLDVNGVRVQAGDGLQVDDPAGVELTLTARADSELLLFDLGG